MSESITLVCRICGAKNRNELFRAREMMFGTREQFNYVKCETCGCLQIDKCPIDLSRFYPPGYYSFAGRNQKIALRKLLRARRVAYALGQRSVLGSLTAAFMG